MTTLSIRHFPNCDVCPARWQGVMQGRRQTAERRPISDFMPLRMDFPSGSRGATRSWHSSWLSVHGQHPPTPTRAAERALCCATESHHRRARSASIDRPGRWMTSLSIRNRSGTATGCGRSLQGEMRLAFERAASDRQRPVLCSVREYSSRVPHAAGSLARNSTPAIVPGVRRHLH